MNARNLCVKALLTACAMTTLTASLQADPPAVPARPVSVVGSAVTLPVPCLGVRPTSTLSDAERRLIYQAIQNMSAAPCPSGVACRAVETVLPAPAVPPMAVARSWTLASNATACVEEPVQVVLEFRLITTAGKALERVGVDFNKATCAVARCASTDKACESTPTRFLNEREMRQFMEFVQGDRRTNVMCAPKMTVCNGQQARIVTSDFRLVATPTVSADRRHVRVQVQFAGTNLGTRCEGTCVASKNPLTVENSVVVPDGGTVILGGMKSAVECCQEECCPILSKVPYVNRLFKNVSTSQEMQHTMLLVTPRIRVSDEVEERVISVIKATPVCPVATAPVAMAPVPVMMKTPRQQMLVAELMRACEAASAEGRDEEAGRYIRAAMAIDPTCLRRGMPGHAPVQPVHHR